MRGQPGLRFHSQRRKRIIPARAGPTGDRGSPRQLSTDHPRSCGANDWKCREGLFTDGSSPLVRGQRGCASRMISACRIIPARAGPTGYRFAVFRHHPDHPRSCGANGLSRHAISYCSGSSPLVRGQPPAMLHTTVRLRIIPARAGPTRRIRAARCPASDHPRSCGANLSSQSPSWSGSGSSPLVRGQRLDMVPCRIEERIIPARAGPTRTMTGLPSSSPDHPRSCGANFVHVHMDSLQHGSSPLVRGQRDNLSRYSATDRIIPARAGPTCSPSFRSLPPPDHPRSCGANAVIPRYLDA